MIKSIRIKFTLWYIVSISILFLLFSVIVFFQLQAFLVNNLDEMLIKGGGFLGEEISGYRMSDETDPQTLYEIGAENELFVEELDDEIQGTFLVSVAFAQLITCPENEATQPEIIVRTSNLGDKHLPFPLKPCNRMPPGTYVLDTLAEPFPFPIRQISIKVSDYDHNPYMLQIGISFQEVPKILRKVLLLAFLLIPLMLLIFSLLGFFFMKKVFSPIREIVRLTDSITAKDLSRRLATTGSNDEIGRLSETINRMIERLEHSFSQIKQFSEDAAHELKTPLAKIRCNAEITLRKDRTEAEYRDVIASLMEDIQKLEKITGDLLLLSRMDSRRIPQTFKRVLLHDVLLRVFEETHEKAHEKHLVFDLDRVDPMEIYADEGLIRTMLVNLIDNAFKYTRPGGKVSITLQKQNSQAHMIIKDTGIGIAEEDLPFIFDRLFRVDPSRSIETGGSGLGLAIVQKIILFHGGEISVQSKIGKGTVFSIHLPRVK
jgi:heavy metal sensor kinase